MLHARHAPWRLPASLVAELQIMYATPLRPYHSIVHIQEVLGWFDQVADANLWRDALVVHAAILFHDAIYIAGRTDNETLSAQRAADALLRFAWPGSRAQVHRVVDLIELTARHGQRTAADINDIDDDAALFLDCDTAILAAPPAAFDVYDAGIAAEYQHLPAPVFRAGRRHFLQMMAQQPRIFLSDFFHDRYDAAARRNLVRAQARYA